MIGQPDRGDNLDVNRAGLHEDEDAMLCLMSALVRHDLSDTIPFTSDIALPCGTHHPASQSQTSQ